MTIEFRFVKHVDSAVHIAPGIVGQITQFVPSGVGKILIIHTGSVGAVAEHMREALSGIATTLVAEVPDAEGAKRIEVASFLWQILGQSEFAREDLIIGVGGGAVTDLAGFVASTWERGIRCILVPTTVAGMVDAAIGGKTAVNTSEGKNLVGTFHMPSVVVIDPAVAQTLSANEVRAGLAEAVKVGFIAEPEILDLIEADVADAIDPTSDRFARIVELAVRHKVTVVDSDLTEQADRVFLNYGHTLGHAIEHAERYQWRHGVAVGIGMMFAAELSRLARGLDESVVDRTRSILQLLELPVTYPADRWSTLLATMQRDKKVRDGALRFVLLDALARPVLHAAPDTSLLFAAYQEIAQ